MGVETKFTVEGLEGVEFDIEKMTIGDMKRFLSGVDGQLATMAKLSGMDVGLFEDGINVFLYRKVLNAITTISLDEKKD